MSDPTTEAHRLDIAHHFATVPDPRHPAFREHHLLGDLLVIALSAVLVGVRSWEGIAEFGRSQEAWLRSRGLKLPHGIPSHDTFNRIFFLGSNPQGSRIPRGEEIRWGGRIGRGFVT